MTLFHTCVIPAQGVLSGGSGDLVESANVNIIVSLRDPCFRTKDITHNRSDAE